MGIDRGGGEAPTCTAPRNRQQAVKMTGKNLRKVRKAAVLSFFWTFVRKLGTRVRKGDQAGFYKYLKTINMEEKRDRSSAYIKDDDGILLKGVELIHETMGLVVPHSTQRQVSDARTEHRRRP